MNKPITLFVLCYIFTIIYSSALSQTKEWKEYTRGNNVSVITEQNGFLWIGTNGGGLTKYNESNGIRTFFSKDNSGLPDMSVNALKVDNSGNIWIGTDNGLAKFTGTAWTIYKKSNSAIPDNNITSIDIDALGRIWVGTYNGIGILDGKIWSVLNTSNSNIPSNNVNVIKLDASGAKWIGTQKGLSKYDGINWYNYNTANSGIPDNIVLTIQFDEMGAAWIGTLNGGLGVLNIDKWAIFNTSSSQIPDNTINSIAIGGGFVWVGTNNGLGRFGQTKWTTFNKTNSNLSNNQVNNVILSGTNVKWIATSDSLNKFDDTNWTKIDPSGSGISDNYILNILNDNNGFIWTGTKNGLSKFDGSAWVNYSKKNSGLPSNFIKSLAKDNINNKWFGTDSGLVKFNGAEWTVFNISNSPLPSNTVNCITGDPNNNLWIGTTNGLAKLNGTNWVIYNTISSPIPGNNIQNIAVENRNKIWIATSSGLALFDGVTWNIFKMANSGLPNDFVTSVFVDKKNVKWISTFGGGIASFDDTNWIIYSSSTTNLPDDMVLSVVKDSSNLIWAGTMVGGLLSYDGSIWTKYNFDNSPITQNTVYSITLDAGNNKWAGTPDGLFVFHKDSIIPSVYVTTVSPSSLCAGNIIIVNFNTLFKYNTGNIFNLELSDRNGIFDYAKKTVILLGSKSSVQSDNIAAVVPLRLQSGFGFRVRITASKPNSISLDNGQDITINEAPIATIQGASSVCYSSIQVYSTPYDKNNTYYWNATNGTVLGSNNNNTATIIWSNTQLTGKVTLLVTNTKGCRDYTEQTISILPHNPRKITGANLVCSGDDRIYMASPDPTITNIWSATGGKVVTMPDINLVKVIWGKAGTGQLKLTEVNKYGCSDSTYFTVLIQPTPNAAFTGNNEVIEGASQIYTSAPVTGIKNKWYVVNGKITGSDTGRTVNVNWSNSGLGVVIHVQRSTAGCVDSLPMVVRIFQKTKLQGLLNVCEDNVETYSATTNLDGSNSWLVQGGSIINSPNERVIYIHWGSAGPGKIRLIQVVPGTSFKDTLDVDVLINSIPPRPTITEYMDTLYSSSPTGNQWYWNGMLLSGETGNTYFTEQIRGIYTVIVSSAPNCVSDMSDPYNFISDVGEINNINDEVSVYPNPNTGIFNLEVNPKIASNFGFKIFNSIGELVLLSKNSDIAEKTIFQVDLQKFASGLYYINALIGQRNYFYKIIINK